MRDLVFCFANNLLRFAAASIFSISFCFATMLPCDEIIFAIAPGNSDLQKPLGPDVREEVVKISSPLLPEHQIIMSPFSLRVFKNSKTAKRVAEKLGLSLDGRDESNFVDLLAELRDHHTLLGPYAAWLTAIQNAHPVKPARVPATDQQIGATADKLAKDFFSFLTRRRSRTIPIQAPRRSESFDGEWVETEAGKRVLRFTNPQSHIPVMELDEAKEFFRETSESGMELKARLQEFLKASAENQMIPLESFWEMLDGLTEFSMQIVTCAANMAGSGVEGEVRSLLRDVLPDNFKVRGGQLPFKSREELMEIKAKVQRTAAAIHVLFTVLDLENFSTNRDYWEELIEPVVE